MIYSVDFIRGNGDILIMHYNSRFESMQEVNSINDTCNAMQCNAMNNDYVRNATVSVTLLTLPVITFTVMTLRYFSLLSRKRR